MELLESEDISLEEAFKAYSQGMELVKRCNERIDRVEKQVFVLLPLRYSSLSIAGRSSCTSEYV